jgi:hypothetical protein
MAPATDEVEEADAGQEEAAAEDGAEDEITTQEEVAPLKAASAPTKPSAADVEEHNITHTPYRSWCDSCVEGRGLGEQRGRHTGRAHEIPRVGIDYWHIITGNLKMRKELVDEYPSMMRVTPRYRLPGLSGKL